MCFVVLRKRETACGPLWAARSVGRPSRGGNRVVCDFHAGGTVHRLFRSSTTADDAPGSTIACGAAVVFPQTGVANRARSILAARPQFGSWGKGERLVSVRCGTTRRRSCASSSATVGIAQLGPRCFSTYVASP
jgi:hypothetical protein